MTSYGFTNHRLSIRYRAYIMFCLLAIATLASCSSEQTAPTEDTDGTRLVITARGGNADPTDIDNHIKSLRLVITKQGSDVLCFNEVFIREASGELTAPEGSKAKITETTDTNGETIIKITESPFNFGTGIYNFYLVANEEGYYRADIANMELSESLTDLKTASDAAKLLNVPSVKALFKTPGTDQPILMSAAYQQWVYSQQDNSIGNIELVRSVARVDFIIKNSTSTTPMTFSNVKLIGHEPTSFNIMESESNYFDPVQTRQSDERTIATTADAGKAITFYLPERLLRTANERDSKYALQIGFTATAYEKTKEYTNKIYIGPYESGGTDTYTGYSIPRNTYYTITANIKKWESNPYIETKVLPWTYKKKESTYDVDYDIAIDGVTKNVKGIYEFMSKETTMEVTVSRITPSGADCKAEFESASESAFMIDGTPTRNGDTYTCRIKPQSGYTPPADGTVEISKLTLYIKVNDEFYPVYLIKMTYKGS